MAGWVSFHRQIMKWEWYTDPNTFRLFFHLVLNANHEKGRWKGNDIERGQFITSSDKLASQLDLSRQQIRTAINKLKSTNEITTKPTNKFTLVTVVNYDFYQDDARKVTNKITTKATNEQPTDNQQVTTNNNDNNKKNENKRFVPPTIDEVKEYCLERQNNVDPLKFINHYESVGWMRGKNKIKSWKACVRTWETNNKNNKPEQKDCRNGVEIIGFGQGVPKRNIRQ